MQQPVLISAGVVLAFCLATTAAFAGTDPERTLKKAVAAGNKAVAIKALDELAQKGDRGSAKIVLIVALKIDELNKQFNATDANAIFAAAKRALAVMSDPGARAYVEKNARSHRDGRVRLVLIEVLATRDDAGALDVLIDALEDKDPVVSGTAARMLGIKKVLASVEPLIALLDRTEGKRAPPWQDAIEALIGISGQHDLEVSADWRNWWKGAKDDFDPKKVKKQSSGAKATVVRKAPKLFGQEILSTRLVFILDVSGSMALKDPVNESGRKTGTLKPGDPGYANCPAERMRLHRLKKAMLEAIRDLPHETKYTILTFAGEIRPWKKDLQPATAKNKGASADFVNGMNPEGFTWTDVALEDSFNIKGANAFYLFSDGIPQRGRTPQGGPDRISTAEILDKVKQWNRLRKVKIYTIGLGEADKKFMFRLADENNGAFTMVD